MRKILEQIHTFSYEHVASNYFRKNSALVYLSNMLSNVWTEYYSVLQKGMDAAEMKYTKKPGTIIMYMEVMKNALFGRLQHPHPYFIEKGIHSTTLVAKHDSKKQAVDEKETVKSMMKMMELMIRAND